MTESDAQDLRVEGRLSSLEAKIDTLALRDAEFLRALKDLQESHRSLASKIDRYQVGAKAVIAVGTTLTGMAWFLWANFGQWLVRR